MLIVEGIEQGSEDWHELRLGCVTASRFKDVLSRGQGKTRKAYMYELASEILTGLPQDNYSNSYIDWGNETEPQARSTYEFETASEVKQVSFVKISAPYSIGCSPDGLVGDDGLVEFKCPKTTTQIETFLSGKMPSGHKPQVQGQLWITEREWCDFVSFDPRINGESSYFCVRQYRDEDYIKSLQKECFSFCDELNELVEKLK